MVIFNYVIKDEEIIGIGPLAAESPQENNGQWFGLNPPKERLPFRLVFLIYTKQNHIKITSQIFAYKAGMASREAMVDELTSHRWQLEYCEYYQYLADSLGMIHSHDYIRLIRERSESEIQRIQRTINITPSES